MIHDALILIRNGLNDFFRRADGGADVGEDKVLFIDGDKPPDPVSFRKNAITPILINVEEENFLRPPDRYIEVMPDGSKQRVNPVIRLNLFVLFVSRFSSYEEGLKYLSLVIKFFQTHRVLDHQNTPELSPEIDRLVIELITMPFTEQNEIWNALRTAYLPSVLYKVRLIVYKDRDTLDTSTVVGQTDPSIFSK